MPTTLTEFVHDPTTSPGHDLDLSIDPAADAPLESVKSAGQFQIISTIARGGMATIYKAVQENPHRVVALKVLRRVLASHPAQRRFDLELQFLARLHHPNIAHVYEAGTYEDSSGEAIPYFAMEYIPGANPITEYAKLLSTREVLDLFTKVGDAVQYAHQKGIIHRDLKPSNILVDASGVPRIIDFGIARAIELDTAQTTTRTSPGTIMGTLEYMSPEQVDADPLELDVRTDVYSLGVILYELLTGQRPYEASSTTIYEAVQVIKESVPRPLSSVDKRLAGDIEAIVHKALEKDRFRRYGSVAEFCEDVRRYLQHEPILARPRSASYTAARFIAQHPWHAVSVLLAIISTLLLAEIIAVLSLTSALLIAASIASLLVGTLVVCLDEQRGIGVWSWIAACLGLALVCTGLLYPRAPLEALLPLKSYPVVTLNGVVVRDDQPARRVTLELHWLLIHPSSVLTAESFVIEATPDFKNDSEDASDEQLELIERILQSGALSMRLHIADAEISPNESNRPMEDGVIRWSVAIRNSGRHQGFLIPTVDVALLAKDDASFLVSADPNADLMITVEARERAASWFPIVTLVVGVPLVLAQLISWIYKGIRKFFTWREERARAIASRPQVVLPD